MTSSDPPASVPAAAALRVTFAYRDRDIRLVAGKRVAMIAPPPVTAPPTSGQSGYWIELRSAAGKLLYHRALSSPLRRDVEVFSDDARQSIARIPVSAHEGRFEVLVPDLPDARTCHFFGTPAGAASEAAASVELFRADVDELRKPRDDKPVPDAGNPPRGTDAQ